MWSIIKKLIKGASEPEEVSKPVNWCLFIKGDGSQDSGVFYSTLNPGIKDCKNGILYIASGDRMPAISRLSSGAAKRAILDAYGVRCSKQKFIKTFLNRR